MHVGQRALEIITLAVQLTLLLLRVFLPILRHARTQFPNVICLHWCSDETVSRCDRKDVSEPPPPRRLVPIAWFCCSASVRSKPQSASADEDTTHRVDGADSWWVGGPQGSSSRFIFAIDAETNSSGTRLHFNKYQ